MVLVAGFLALAAGTLGAAADAGAETVTAALTQLRNPRGVATDMVSGAAYVAESGSGEAGSGRISRWWNGTAAVVADGLASTIDDEGAVAGPAGIGLTTLGVLSLNFTYAGGSRDAPFSSLQRALRPTAAVDVKAYDNEHPEPTAGPPTTDSDAYGIAVLRDGSVLVADAAANNLKQVFPQGGVQIVARFPNRGVTPPFPGMPNPFPAQPVPTSVAVGPDGWWYVGELIGFPFPSGKSRIWKIMPGTMDAACDPAADANAACQLVADDFTAIVGLAFGPDGTMYVSEMAKGGLLGLLVQHDTSPQAMGGALIAVAPDGTRREIAAGMLTLPGGVAVANDGSVFVANRSISPDDGELLKIDP
jgi:hypothetical protein